MSPIRWLFCRVTSAPMSTTASKIAQLSITSPIVFKASQPNIDPFISSRNNVLSIDLAENQTPIQVSDDLPGYPLREDLMANSVRVELEALKASQGPVHIHESRGWPRPEFLDRNVLLIHRIRKLVSEDAARQPEDRIDCVEIGPEPWPEHLRALDGLSPKHLQVAAGNTEAINVFELDELNTKFKPESLCVSGVLHDWSVPMPTSNTIPSSSSMDPIPSKPQYNHRFPEFFTHVRSLTLEYCCSIFFKGTNLPAHLRRLRIIGNNAMDMFTFAVDNVPNASERLEKVFIYTDPRLDMTYAFWLDDFRERLARCKGLKELTLIIADDYEARAADYADMVARFPKAPGEPEGEDGSEPFDVGLSQSLPKGIERLEFHCSNSEPMLADLDLWIEAAKDPEWLPRLKYIHICTYDTEMDKFRLSDKPATAVDPGRDKMFSEKIRTVYEALQSRNPPVEIGQ